MGDVGTADLWYAREAYVSFGTWFFLRRQRSLQYFTFFHTFSHFLRQTKERSQTGQSLVGRCSFLRFIIVV